MLNLQGKVSMVQMMKGIQQWQILASPGNLPDTSSGPGTMTDPSGYMTRDPVGVKVILIHVSMGDWVDQLIETSWGVVVIKPDNIGNILCMPIVDPNAPGGIGDWREMWPHLYQSAYIVLDEVVNETLRECDADVEDGVMKGDCGVDSTWSMRDLIH
jgi:hypothetical protein